MKKFVLVCIIAILTVGLFNASLVNAAVTPYTVDLNGGLANSSPVGTTDHSSSQTLIEFYLRPTGGDLVVNKIFAYQSNFLLHANDYIDMSVKDLKLYFNGSQTPIANAIVNNIITFDDLNLSLKNSNTYTFEIKADTTAARGDYNITVGPINTTPSAFSSTAIEGNTLYFTPHSSIYNYVTVSLGSDSPAGNGVKSTSAPIMKFKLSADNDVIIDRLVFWEKNIGSILGHATDYKVFDLDNSITYPSNSSIDERNFSITGLTMSLPKNVEKTFEVRANTTNTTGTYQLQLFNIISTSAISLNGLPLYSNQLNFGASATSPANSEPSASTPISGGETATPATSAPSSAYPSSNSSTNETAASLQRLQGKLLLQVEQGGAIWYVSKTEYKRYKVTFANALPLFEKLSLGITDSNLAKIPVAGSGQTGDLTLRNRLKGRLLLAVEKGGMIWYVDFNGYRHNVTWSNLMDLFESLSLGITNVNLNLIPVGTLN